MANALKEIPCFLVNKGLVLDKPEEFLKNQYSTGDSRNLEFFDEELRGRLGLLKFDTKQLSGPVLLQEQFWKYVGTWFYMICTTKDIYRYDFNAKVFDILTPIYDTGTISIGTGAAALIVIGTGGANFTTGGIKAGDYLKIGTGGVNADATWYEVDTKDSATQLTLKTAPTGISGSQYTIRKCFTGGSTDQWHSVTYQDAILGELWVTTNGKDGIVRYGGTGQVTPLAGLPTGFVTCKFLDVYKDRLILLNTIETGAQPQRERWSAVANCESYDDLDFLDFIEGGYWITGSLVWNGYHIVFRERDAMVGRWVGGTAIFSYEGNNSCSGVWAANSITSTQNKIYYYGPDNKFHSWNLMTEDDISDPILPYSVNFDPNLESQIFGYQCESRSQMRWFVPYGNPTYMNACVVWDYNNENLYIWEYQAEQACCSISEYLNSVDLYIDDAFWGELYVDEQDGFWDDKMFLDGCPQIVYGGYDGYIRKVDIGYFDDVDSDGTGVPYSRVFESVRINYKAPNLVKRLWKIQAWLKSDTSGVVTVDLKKDDRYSYEAGSKSISLVDSTRDIIKKNLTFDKHGQNFKFKFSSTSHFSLLGFISYIFLKGNTNRG